MKTQPIVVGEPESDFGTRHGNALDDFGYALGFGAVGPEEFEPGRRGEKQIPNLGAGALGMGGGRGTGNFAAVDLNFPGAFPVWRP